jgi:hypothetical protein
VMEVTGTPRRVLSTHPADINVPKTVARLTVTLKDMPVPKACILPVLDAGRWPLWDSDGPCAV